MSAWLLLMATTPLVVRHGLSSRIKLSGYRLNESTRAQIIGEFAREDLTR